MREINLTETRISLIQEDNAFSYNGQMYQTICEPVPLDGTAHTVITVCKNISNNSLLAVPSNTVILAGIPITIKYALELGYDLVCYNGRTAKIYSVDNSYVAQIVLTGTSNALEPDSLVIV